ncbi:hypothetical protein N7494_001636 [Penicillium frequentans]|uniref:Uncharacterized protein n=1 Tax=Penicillium frequentans TaxID=3151616 RepID=A0AAD6D250_9EURO|nr:hypothetical protein N7494_001636 [Penicillium glabrum]
MGILSCVALALCLITFLLWWRSANNYGLGTDDGSAALLFGWRYSPTMIVVIYVQLTAMLFDDVKRTEPFARLARPEGAKASNSILHTPGPWWTALYDGFSKKKNGRRSWILICASFVNILGFLAISPLSSAYLYSEDLDVPQTTDFFQLAPLSDSPLPIDADRTTHFRTIANLLQNVSTSPWITDNYTILPFWPADLQDEPINSLPTSSTQTWKGETTMFRSELSCTEMTVEAQANSSISFEKGQAAQDAISVMWSSPSGCKYGLEVVERAFLIGGGSWSNTSTFFYPEDIMTVDQKSSRVNHTTECDGQEVIVVTESWASSKGLYSAHLCDTKYYMANITASVALDGDEPEISFNESDYEQNKVTIPETLFNATQFRDQVLNAEWPTYMISIIWSDTALLGGAGILLGALYNYNMTELVRDPNMITSAGKARQRFFGEVLQSALTQNGASQKVSMQGQVNSVETRVVVQSGAAIALGILFAISFLLVVTVWWLSQLRKRPLNLQRDPATVVGVAYLIAQNPRTRSGFQCLRQPSSNELQKRLDGELFYTDSSGLSKSSPDTAREHESPQSKNGTPFILRLPALIILVTLFALVITGVAVLYHYAESYRLYGKAFVYEIQLSMFGSDISSIAPFSMIPTVIATLLGLWWGAIDGDFRRLQPFLAMSDRNPPYKKGVDLSYQTSYWFWAAGKAVFNKHWMLFLVTLGSTLSPVYTTSMSALFDRGAGNILQPVTLERQLEVRDIPFVFETQQAFLGTSSDTYTAVILEELFQNISSYWMYTATIQLALNGSQPAWSKDGWSFVPLDLSNITSAKSLSTLGASTADDTSSDPGTNVTFETPAIRGRIQCSQPSVQILANVSNWLTMVDLSNHTIYNKSTIPTGLEGGYQLGNKFDSLQYPSVITPLSASQNWTECPGCTTVFANPSEIICCGNGSADSRLGEVGVGYWSPNEEISTWSPRLWQRNFTAKWFHGEAATGIKVNDDEVDLSVTDPYLLFSEPPSMSLFNCEPIVEMANAKITVNPTNGEIQTFDILSTPETVSEPWSDNFLPHNSSYTKMRESTTYYNVTLSYGRLFMAALLTSADTLHIGGAAHSLGYTIEDLDDNTYNIRDEMNGLNMDFMTYAMYTMAGKDPTALLDPETFTQLAEKTYTTFFQHFVSNNVSMETGGWAYQKVNASLPSDIGPVIDWSAYYLSGRTVSKYQDVNPISHTNRTVSAHISQRVELLQMNAVAVWLSIGIMGWLILTTIVVAILHRRYFGSLVRNVECLGDVLVLISGSANFLQVVREIESGKLLAGDYEGLRTRLGWFVDEDGGLRWGIEMEESYGEGPGVHWVSEPEFSKERNSTWNVRDGEENI